MDREGITPEEFVIKRNSLRQRIKEDIAWISSIIEKEEKELQSLEKKTKSLFSYLFK